MLSFIHSGLDPEIDQESESVQRTLLPLRLLYARSVSSRGCCAPLAVLVPGPGARDGDSGIAERRIHPSSGNDHVIHHLALDHVCRIEPVVFKNREYVNVFNRNAYM